MYREEERKKMSDIIERFNSIKELLSTLDSRENNEYMQYEHQSERSSATFTKTKSYEEAVYMLRTGYLDPLKKIKMACRKVSKDYSNAIADVDRRQVRNMPIGYVPNVPNTLLGRPDSMINITNKPIKKKCINIIYANSVGASYDADDFIAAGTRLVSAINIIERSGTQVKLDVAFVTAKKTKQRICGVLKIKGYGERFNLQKVTFPLVHPSMMRRIGFKFLETVPGMEEDFSADYGNPIDSDELAEMFETNNQTYILTMKEVEAMNGVDEVLKYFGQK
jgi:hypothetical protein